jgi:hypothetical protein
MSGTIQNFIRHTLGVLLAFAALTAFGGGYYAISGANGVPTSWLEGSPFRDYFIPGLVLFVLVGGSFLFASISVFARFHFARVAVFCAVIIVFLWLTVKVSIIGYVSWMQPTTAAAGIIILVLTRLLPKVD